MKREIQEEFIVEIKDRKKPALFWLRRVVTLAAAFTVLFVALSVSGGSDALYAFIGAHTPVEADVEAERLSDTGAAVAVPVVSTDFFDQVVTAGTGDFIQSKADTEEYVAWYNRPGYVVEPEDEPFIGPAYTAAEQESIEQFVSTAATEQAEEVLEAVAAPVEEELFSAPEEPEPEPTPAPEPVFKENNDSSLPMDELVDVRKNSDGSGVLVFKSGRTARYKYIKNMTATAYNKDEPKVGTITASGTKVHKGVVAVDRKVIPLGTKMYIVANGYEYGYSVAEDTGVFGNIIDLYFESYRGMINFGRRPCVCYILE